METKAQGPIGVFDSGFGGLSILREVRKVLPQYDYLFLGDNARAPYGTRSYQLVYEFTLQAVKYLFGQGCQLVILACNTASAKALRTIQQRDLPHIAPTRRVLGVIRPTVEAVGQFTRTRHIGVFGTPGTIQSGSYDIEIAHLYPHFKVYGHAGRPVLYIPTQDKRFFYFEDVRMTDIWAPWIESGRVMVFTVDTMDGETWSNKGGDPYWRARRHEQWMHYITDEFVPFMREMVNHRNEWTG